VQVHGLTRDLRTRVLQATADRLRDRRTRALRAVADARLGRRSALVARAVADRERAPDGSATVRRRRRTTDPAGPGSPALSPPIPWPPWRPGSPRLGLTTGLVCRARTQGGRVRARLAAEAVARLGTPMAQAAGLAPALVQGLAGHRARVGAAQDRAVHGIALAGIMPAGR